MKLPVAPLAFAFAAALAGMVAVGCGAGATFSDGVFRDGKVAFRVGEVPREWHRIEVSHASLAFRDDVHEATILVNARCATMDGDTPLLALTNHLLIGTTEREVLSQATEPFDGREALHSAIRAKLDGVPMAFELFVAKKDGCIYDFVQVSAEGRGDATTFSRFVRSFHTLPGSGAS